MVLLPASSWPRSLPTEKLSGSGTIQRSNRSVLLRIKRRERPPAACGGSPPISEGELLSPLERRTAAKRQGIAHTSYRNRAVLSDTSSSVQVSYCSSSAQRPCYFPRKNKP